MKIIEISPRMYEVDKFKYTLNDPRYKRIEAKKSQYLYRLFYVTKGNFKIHIENEAYNCGVGDVVYLIPGDVYNFELCDSGFSMYNTFFDLFPGRVEDNIDLLSCIFAGDYAEGRRLPLPNFEDAPLINKSGVFKNVDCFKQFETLVSVDRSNPLFALHTSSAILTIISAILSSAKQNKSKNASVEDILSYIRLNPEKDLSTSRLSEEFSYHKNYLNHLIKKNTGKSLSEYVRSTKMEHAKTLIAEGGISLNQIAVMLGYYDYSHFYKAFISETGITPAEFLSKKNR